MAESPRRKCLFCGKKLAASKRYDAMYCSGLCQKRAAARRQYERKIISSSKSPQGEAEVVLTQDFANVLIQWKNDYDTKYGITPRTDFINDGVTAAFMWLSAESGVSDRYLRGIVSNEYAKYISLWRVDKILTAAGLHHLLMNGTLKVIPNPKWSNEDWVEYMRQRGCG